MSDLKRRKSNIYYFMRPAISLVPFPKRVFNGMDKKYLIVVGGPTASGKTSVAVEMAKHFKTEILSADSRQFYREMQVGTAKPSAEELAAVPHHFINSLNIGQAYSVGDFERDAIGLLEQLFRKKNVLVMAGGSGLYIRAVCDGLDQFPDVPHEVKRGLEDDFEKHGIVFLQKELQQSDPIYYSEMDTSNPHRLLRALAVCRASGQPFSSFRKKNKIARIFEPIYILLEWERQALYDRINQRVDEMMKNGLLEEAKSLHPFKHLNALQTVGYQELFDHFDGKTTLPEAIEMIKQNTRRYAKRQMTWFRKDEHWQRFSPLEFDGINAYLASKMG